MYGLSGNKDYYYYVKCPALKCSLLATHKMILIFSKTKNMFVIKTLKKSSYKLTD